MMCVQGELGVELGFDGERLGVGHMPMEHVVLHIDRKKKEMSSEHNKTNTGKEREVGGSSATLL